MAQPVDTALPPCVPKDAAAASCAAWGGDVAAFEVIYRQWFPRVFGMARGLTRRDEAFCLDVTQDVMLRAGRRLPRIGSETELAAWFGRVTLGAAIDQVRRECRRTKRERRWAGVAGGDTYESLSQDDLGVIAHAFSRLDPQEQVLLMQRIAHGLSLKQAGAALGIGTQAAHGRVRRAIARLRGFMKGVHP